MKLAEDEGLVVDLPPKIQNSAGDLVALDEFFGGGFSRDRATEAAEGIPDTAPPAVDMSKPKNAVYVQAAPADSVWVAAEPLGGLVLGQEVSLITQMFKLLIGQP